MRYLISCLLLSWIVFLSSCPTAAQETAPASTRTDADGLPLPTGALARIGTRKYRIPHGHGLDCSGRISPDGKLMAAANLFGEIELWELPQWSNRRVLQVPGGENVKNRSALTDTLRFSPDGKILAIADRNRRVLFFDPAAAQCTRTFNLPDDWHRLEIVVARDNRKCVVAAYDANGGQWTCFAGDLGKGTLKHLCARRGDCLAMSDDCRWLAVAGARLTLVDLTTGQNAWEVKLTGRASDVALSPDGKRIILVADAGVRMHDIERGEELCNQRGRLRWARYLAHAPDGKSFYLGDADGTIARLDAVTARHISSHPSPAARGHLRQLAFTPEGRALAFAQAWYSDRVCLWDVHDGKNLSSPATTGLWHSWVDDDLRFSADGKLYVGIDGKGKWWNPRTGAPLGEAGPKPDSPLGVATSQHSACFDQGTKTASLRNDAVRIWDTRSGRETAQFAFPLGLAEEASLLAASDNGRYFLVATFDVARPLALRPGEADTKVPARLCVWDREAMTAVAVWKNDVADVKPALSPDGRWLAYVSTNGKTYLRRVAGTTASEKDALDLEKIGGRVGSLVFSPDGRQLACTVNHEHQSKIGLFDTSSGALGRVVHGDRDSHLLYVTYAPDSSLLAAVDRATVLVWETGLRGKPAAAAADVPPRKEPDKAKPPPPLLAGPPAADDPLPAGALRRLGTTSYRLPDSIQINSVRLAPDGRRLAGIDAEGVIQTWNLPAWSAGPSIRPMPSAQEKTPHFRQLAFTEDGTLTAYDSSDRLVFCDLAGGKCGRHLVLPANFRTWVLDVAISPDRRTLVCPGLAEGTHETLVFDLAENKLRHSIRVPIVTYSAKPAPVPLSSRTSTRIAFHINDRNWWPVHAVSADCRWLAVANRLEPYDIDGHYIELWDCATGKSARRIDILAAVKHMVFSHDGKWLAVQLAWEPTIRIYETASGKEAHNLHQFDSNCEMFVFAPDDKSLYVAQGDKKTIRQWSMATGETAATFASPCRHSAQQFAFAAAGPERQGPRGPVVLAQIDRNVHCWEPVSQKLHSPAGAWRHPISALQFSEQGDLFVATQAGEASWWNPHTGICKQNVNLEGFKNHFSPNLMAGCGDLLACCEFEEAYRSWTNASIIDLKTGKLLWIDAATGVDEVSFFARGQKAASLTLNAVRIWDTRDGRDLAHFGTSLSVAGESLMALKSTCVSENGRYFAFGSIFRIGDNGDEAEARVVLWDHEKRKVEGMWPTLYLGAKMMRFSADNRWLVIQEASHRLRLIGIGSPLRESILEVGENEAFRCLAFSPDGRELACAVSRPTDSGSTNRIVIYELASRSIRAELAGHGGAAIYCLAYSPDGGLLASGGDDATVLLWPTGLRGGKLLAGKKDADLRSCLAQLTGGDAGAAYEAMTRLAQDPDQAVKLLAEKFGPVEKPSLKGRPLADWVRDLGDDSYAVRTEASALLLRMGPDLAADLRTALAVTKDLETRRRLEDLLGKLTTRPMTPEGVVHVRVVELAEAIATPAALALLRRWSEGYPGAMLTAEARRALWRMN